MATILICGVMTALTTGNIRYQMPGTEAWAAQMLEKIRNANKTK